MEKVEVTHRLDLVVRLIDTTTGREISERNVCFKEEERLAPFLYKGDGTYILMNSIRASTTYTIQVFGYEDAMISVEYGESTNKYLMKEVPMIPKEIAYSYASVITMRGHLDGITEIDAIRLSLFDRTMKEYDNKRNVINYYGGMEMTEREYALLHKETMSYEIFRIKKVINKTSVLIRRPLEMPYAVKDPIMRIVKGKVMPNHEYILRVRDDGQKCVYLVRYKVNGNTYFKRVDFRNEEERSLNQ